MKEQETEFGIIKDDKVFLKAWGEFPEREIGEVRDNNPEESFKYFQEKYTELDQKIADLEKLIEESVNKGSFLMKLLHLKELVASHDGLGDYQALIDRLERQEALLQDIISKNRERNAEIKKTLIEEIKVAADKINWKEATTDIHDIKSRWIKTGNAPEEENTELEEAFWAVVTAFFDKKKAFYEDKKRLGEKNKEAYEKLVKEASKVAELHGKQRFDKIKELKASWKEIGNIPKEEYGPLVNDFNKHLKPGQKPQQTNVDLDAIISEVDRFLAFAEKPDMKKLEDFRQSLKNYRPQEYKAKQLRKEAFTKIQMLKEWDFVVSIARKRFKDFSIKDHSDRKALEIKILEEFLSRDREDLARYLENSEKFSSPSGEINPIVEKQLYQQKSKVAVKEELLSLLKKT